MNFDHLDDPDPFIADATLKRAVQSDGEQRRRRVRARRIALSSCTVLVLLASLFGISAWTTTRVDRVHVGFTAPPVTLSKPFNVLLIGSDRQISASPTVDNADAVMIVRVDPIKARISVLSIPRDLAVNGAEGPRVAELLHGEPDRLAEIIQRKLGLPLSAFVELSFEGLVTLADAFGGLEVAVTEDIADPSTGLDLQSSECTRLNGDELFAALRSRRPITTTAAGAIADSTSDEGRRERQRALLSILFSQVHRLTTNPDTFDRMFDIAVHELQVDDRIDLGTMMAIAKWFASTTVDITSGDLPTDWTTAANQRRVLVTTPQSSSAITDFTSDSSSFSAESVLTNGAFQPFAPCP